MRGLPVGAVVSVKILTEADTVLPVDLNMCIIRCYLRQTAFALLEGPSAQLPVTGSLIVAEQHCVQMFYS